MRWGVESKQRRGGVGWAGLEKTRYKFLYHSGYSSDCLFFNPSVAVETGASVKSVERTLTRNGKTGQFKK